MAVLAAVRAAVLLLVAACTPARQYIHYDAQRNVITAKPSYIATGDDLFLVVHDTLYKNRYVPNLGTAEVVVGERSPIYGGADVGKLLAAFPAQVFGLAAKSAAAAGGTSTSTLPPLEPESIRAGQESEAPRRRRPKRAATGDSLRFLVRARDQAITAACGTTLEDAARYFLARPSQSALLAFLVDTGVHARARQLAGRGPKGSPAPALREADVDTISDTLALRSLRAEELDAYERRGARYAREASAFALRLGVASASFEPDADGFGKQLTALQGCADARVLKAPNVARLQATIDTLWSKPGMPPADLTPADRQPAFAPIHVAGVDVEKLLERDSTTMRGVQDLYGDLSTIARVTNRVTTALNLVPGFATRCGPPPVARSDSAAAANTVYATPCGDPRQHAGADVLYVGRFWKSVQVQVTPARGDRYAPFAPPPVITFAKVESATAPAPTASSTGAGGGNGASGGTGGGGGGSKSGEKGDKGSAKDSAKSGDKGADAGGDKGATGGAGAAAAAAAPTMPTAAVDVLERDRFQVAFGYGRSSLTTFVYETKDDTVVGTTGEKVPGTQVRVTGRSPAQYFPVATLSYVVLPPRGKVFGAQAYDVRGDGPWWKVPLRYAWQAGLAAQLGVSLQDPSKQLFTGVATEPLPGVTVGWGRYSTYVDRSRFTADTFVARATDPTPVRKQWVGEWSAWTASIDGAVILAAFGKLLGLK